MPGERMVVGMPRMCDRCGYEVADLARFCSNCGAALVDMTGDSVVEVTNTMEPETTLTGPLTPVTAPVPAVAPGTAMLIVRRGPSEGTSFTLANDVITVGRADDADVMLDDVTVSRRHAQFLRTVSGWVLRDVGSLNGTYLNRTLIDEAVLAGGDEVQIGKYRFLFLVGGQR